MSDGGASTLSVRLFGAFEVYVNGAPLPRLRSRKGEWLLALLALRAGREVERAWLMGQLWPDSAETPAGRNLRNSLRDLRHALGPTARRLYSPSVHTLALDPSGAEIDVVRFDRCIARGDPTSLEEAVALYRGPLLEGCVEPWAFQEREHREHAFLQSLEDLAWEATRQGDPAAAEGHLRRVVTVDPLREGAQRALMQALAAQGSYAAAVLVYRELRVLLHRELNAAPAPETTALFDQIRAEAREKAALGSGLWALGSGLWVGRAAALGKDGRPPSVPRAQSGSEATLTFLFTDLEGSTRLWEADPKGMREALFAHEALLGQAIESNGGRLFKTMGDQVCAAFATAPGALAAAMAAQRALLGHDWSRYFRRPGQTEAAGYALRARMALNTGTATERDGDYYGPALNRVARLLGVGHGGQTLLTRASYDLVRDHLPEGADLRDLGEHRLKDLAWPERIFQLVAPDLPAEFPPLRSLSLLPHNLPQPATSFIGREREIGEVKRLLEGTRLLTLTGAGGTGKTRLALQVAAERVPEERDGVWLVELAALADPALVPQAVATTLAVHEQPGVALIRTLVDVLKQRQLLLLLDNCEHLIAACAELSAALLRGCPRVTILATSREGFRIAGETTYRVPPLSLPVVGSWLLVAGKEAATPSSPTTKNQQLTTLLQSEAVQLFLDRAAAALPSFTLGPETAPAVARICARLDGIPLAIELAAARVRVLPVETISERLADRFRLLAGGDRTALPRHQTLRALIDWSYDLLSESEALLLRRLSVFSGGWTLVAAEAVCRGLLIADCRLMIEETPTPSPISNQQSAISNPEDVLDLLTSLVEKSLVVYEPQDGQGRYRLLETVHQYARDRLCESGAEQAGRARHLAFFVDFAEEAEPWVRSEDPAWLDRCEREHDNLRAALAWSAENGEAEAGLRLAGALSLFWRYRGHDREGCGWLEKALAAGGTAPGRVRMKALLGIGLLALYGDDLGVARASFEESLAIARELGDRHGIVRSLERLAGVAWMERDLGAARSLFEESVALWRAIGDGHGIAISLQNLGQFLSGQGELDRAWALCEESLALHQELGERGGMAHALLNLGAIASARGDWAVARRYCQQSLPLWRELGHPWGLADCLDAVANLDGSEGRFEQAARLFGAAAALRADRGKTMERGWRAVYEHVVRRFGAELDESAFAAAWGAGRALSIEEAVVEALAEP